MLITRVELENIKSYRRIAVDFRRGTTAIGGANGSGKTTLVEAIGYALFDYLPYNQTQFVREGEKYGRIVVHLVGSDARTYEVERRCGSGSYWFIYDCEADYRVEQRADVQDKLHELFGIDSERPLDTLFQDALGVPQGTFTAIFLQTPSKRKQTFDALLQIEDYKTAADYLLEAQKHYKEQMQAQQAEIQRLTFETRGLETWQTLLKEARLLDQQQTEQNADWTQQLTRSEQRLDVLKEQQTQLHQLQQRYEQHKTRYEAAQQRLQDRERDVNAARTAQGAVRANATHYQRYLQADELLRGLRQEEQQRNELLQRRATLAQALASMQANIAHWQIRLEEVAKARLLVVELAPQVDKQIEMEKERDDLATKVARHETLLKRYKELRQKQTTHQKQQDTLRRRIAEIQPLQPLAELLTLRVETLTRLRAQKDARNDRLRKLQEKQGQLAEKQQNREQVAASMRKVEQRIASTEEHRQEAEQVPVLQEQAGQLAAQQHRLLGNIEAYTDSRTQSVGGQCPLLHQTCLNIKQQGLESLESYFDSLLTEERARLVDVEQQQSSVGERIKRTKKYADELSKLSQYTEQHDGFAEQLQRLKLDIARLEGEVADLVKEVDALKQIDADIVLATKEHTESVQADQQVRLLDGLDKQIQQLQEQVQQLTLEMQECQEEGSTLSGSAEQLAGVKRELETLNDPRSRSKAQQELVKREPSDRQHLQADQQKEQETQQKLQTFDEQLATHAQLDAQINEQETLRQQSQVGYQTYLQHEQNAQLLPEREQAYQQAISTMEAARHVLSEAEQAYVQARALFSEEDLIQIDKHIRQLRDQLAELAESMRNLQLRVNALEQDIQRATALLVELQAAQQELATLEELVTMMEQFRKLIKEAAPYVLKALLGDISAEANRIFGEIMGDRSGQLSWQNDYEILLRRQSINRTFAQLSGGEQMSAALAVRLALLKKLSTLNIAFFDEPTQNMDELRRVNLAEQIRRVRGFDQLIVISHDDTFEQSLDSLVRLRKVDGETRLTVDEDGVSATTDTSFIEREQVQIHAS